MAMVDLSVPSSMPGSGLEGENLALVGVDGWGWLAFRLLHATSGFRCTVEGVQKMIVLQRGSRICSGNAEKTNAELKTNAEWIGHECKLHG